MTSERRRQARQREAHGGFGLLQEASRSRFEHQIALVRRVLGVPVALISLVEENRQIFAAHLGLPEPWAEIGETPLTHSFCQHVVEDHAPFSVDNAREHPRVRDNLAIAELGVCAYLGVPLALPDGEVVGALAAIDSKPRAWTDEDRSLLEAIAAVVSDEIETHLSESRWRDLFEQLQEGVMLGDAVRDEAGRMIDWRHVQVNPTWSELTGVPAEDAIGRTALELFPDLEAEWIEDFARVVDTGTASRFTRQVRSLGRWYEGFAQTTGPDSFAVLFVDVSDRVRADHALRQGEKRAQRTQELQAALLAMGDRLRVLHTVADTAFAAAETMARMLGATRAGYGIVDAARETVVIQPDWCAPGVPSAAGEHRFADFGSFIEDLKVGRLVAIADVRADPRTADSAQAFDALGIRTLINMPVLDHGVFTGVLFVHYDKPHMLSPEELSFLHAGADRTLAAIARLHAEAEQRVLNAEISHRLKNSLALVQAVASQTLRGVKERTAVEAFEKRLHALSAAHDVLLRQDWTAAAMKDVVMAAMQNLSQFERFSVDGPEVKLGPRAALSLSLMIHELATNALKYGALSGSSGHVTVAWRIEGNALRFSWRETGGPPLQPRGGEGFGSRLIRMGLGGTGGVETRFPSTGFEADMEALLDHLRS